MLNTQRRMVPEVREILMPFYPMLEDHPSVRDRVNNRPHVPGMGGIDTYFFHHHWPESRDDASSRSNVDEAEMIAGLFDYLVLNGVEPNLITVLTYYNGQKKTIINELRKRQNLRVTTHFNVFTVDSYQGEENDIVLVSLVRSNERGSVGFLNNRNRAVVAMSRARRGLYVFGNAQTLALNPEDLDSFELWGDITTVFRGQCRLGTSLPLTCTNHGTQTFIEEAIDWDMKGLTGGCEVKCQGQLPCGHPCPHRCHP